MSGSEIVFETLISRKTGIQDFCGKPDMENMLKVIAITRMFEIRNLNYCY